MPAPTSCEILGLRDRDPAREGTRRDLTVLIREAEHACRVEGMPEDRRFSDEAVLCLAGHDRYGRMVKIGALADIERRMGVEDLQSAQQEERKADDIDPMRYTHQPGMPAIPALRSRPIRDEDCHIRLRHF